MSATCGCGLTQRKTSEFAVSPPITPVCCLIDQKNTEKHEQAPLTFISMNVALSLIIVFSFSSIHQWEEHLENVHSVY